MSESYREKWESIRRFWYNVLKWYLSKVETGAENNVIEFKRKDK